MSVVIAGRKTKSAFKNAEIENRKLLDSLAEESIRLFLQAEKDQNPIMVLPSIYHEVVCQSILITKCHNNEIQVLNEILSLLKEIKKGLESG